MPSRPFTYLRSDCDALSNALRRTLGSELTTLRAAIFGSPDSADRESKTSKISHNTLAGVIIQGGVTARVCNSEVRPRLAWMWPVEGAAVKVCTRWWGVPTTVGSPAGQAEAYSVLWCDCMDDTM